MLYLNKYKCNMEGKRTILSGMLLILTIVTLGSIANKQASDCGMSLPLKITYTPGVSAAEYPHYPNPTVGLFSVVPFENQSTIAIQLDRRGQERPIKYISNNHGEMWVNSDWILGYTNLRKWSNSDRLMSHVDRNVLYDCYYKCKGSFARSIDGGKTWTNIVPTIAGKIAIDEIELLETGMHAPNRLYASISVATGQEFRCAVSNDYGQSFAWLPKEIIKIVESRADENVWYGTLKSRPWLAISRDAGSTWLSMDGSSEFWKPFYRNPVRRYFRSWNQYPEDIEVPSIVPIDQIESDPTHPDWIYILTYKGLYLSRDAGKTFRLSSLAQGRLYSIDRIAVDPLDGRFIYAVVDLGQFYRSSDYGCSWEKMNGPE